MRSIFKRFSDLIALFICIYLLYPVPGRCGDYQEFPPDIKRIKERGRLVVAMYYKDVKPYIFHTQGLLDYQEDRQVLVKNDGTSLDCQEQPETCGVSSEYFIGYDVELARGIAQALGVELEFDRSPKTFNAIIDCVASEQVDMAISLVSRTLSRAAKVRFSSPYIILKPTILMNRLDAERYQIDPADPLAALSNFKGKIAEKKGTSYINIAEEIFPEAEIIEYPEWIDAMTSVLESGVIAIRDEIGVKNYISRYADQSIIMKMINLAGPRFADPIAIALPANSIHLQEWVNLYLEKHGTIGNADNLLKQYQSYYE
jgi:polar amino acid transport system substrate-binding protein